MYFIIYTLKHSLLIYRAITVILKGILVSKIDSTPWDIVADLCGLQYLSELGKSMRLTPHGSHWFLIGITAHQNIPICGVPRNLSLEGEMTLLLLPGADRDLIFLPQLFENRACSCDIDLLNWLLTLGTLNFKEEQRSWDY